MWELRASSYIERRLFVVLPLIKLKRFYQLGMTHDSLLVYLWNVIIQKYHNKSFVTKAFVAKNATNNAVFLNHKVKTFVFELYAHFLDQSDSKCDHQGRSIQFENSSDFKWQFGQIEVHSIFGSLWRFICRLNLQFTKEFCCLAFGSKTSIKLWSVSIEAIPPKSPKIHRLKYIY